MREIKFRGISKITNKWVYGNLTVSLKGGYYISKDRELFSEPVHKESVGQYMGLLDKEGKEIYEGDVINYKGVMFVIKFKEGRFYGWNNELTQIGILSPIFEKMYASKLIGNIYENGNLLKGDEDGS